VSQTNILTVDTLFSASFQLKLVLKLPQVSKLWVGSAKLKPAVAPYSCLLPHCDLAVCNQHRYPANVICDYDTTLNTPQHKSRVHAALYPAS